MANPELIEQQVRSLLASAGLPLEYPPPGGTSYRVGDTQAFVRVTAKEIKAGATNVMVEIHAPIIVEAPRSAPLFEYIATKGDDRHFGHMVAIEGQDPQTVNVLMVHRLFGDDLQPEAFMAAAMIVAITTGQLKAWMAQAFGGQPFG